MSADITINISVDGHLTFVYDDALIGLIEQGDAQVARVSHVEPFQGGWTADMRPVNGPVLFADGECSLRGTLLCSVLTPFKTRAEALQAERDWLAEHRGL